MEIIYFNISEDFKHSFSLSNASALGELYLRSLTDDLCRRQFEIMTLEIDQEGLFRLFRDRFASDESVFIGRYQAEIDHLFGVQKIVFLPKSIVIYVHHVNNPFSKFLAIHAPYLTEVIVSPATQDIAA